MTSSELLLIISAKTIFKQDNILDFPGGPVVENPPANAEGTGSVLVWEDSTCLRGTKPICHNY